jgi:hypothetical protein
MNLQHAAQLFLKKNGDKINDDEWATITLGLEAAEADKNGDFGLIIDFNPSPIMRRLLNMMGFNVGGAHTDTINGKQYPHWRISPIIWTSVNRYIQ